MLWAVMCSAAVAQSAYYETKVFTETDRAAWLATSCEDES